MSAWYVTDAGGKGTTTMSELSPAESEHVRTQFECARYDYKEVVDGVEIYMCVSRRPNGTVEYFHYWVLPTTNHNSRS